MSWKPKKLLLAHNYYSRKSPSGENAVFDQEKRLLEHFGHEVQILTEESDAIYQSRKPTWVKTALLAPYNPGIGPRVKKLLDNFHPDLLHAHNTFPLISPAIFRMVGDRCPKVLTLHNYRLLCPNATLFRNDRPCFECISPLGPLPSVFHGCYRNSRLASASVAATVALHHLIGTWKRHVDAFIALSEYQKDLLIQAGLPKGKIHVKPNCCSEESILSLSRHERQTECLFVGRLSPEKGLSMLIDAWRQWGPKAPVLRIVGDGDQREALQKAANDLPIQFKGILSPELVRQEMATARLLIVPSTCVETFSLVIIEAMSQGTPVLVSNLGSLPDLVAQSRSGFTFKSGDSDELLRILQEIWAQPKLLRKVGDQGRKAYESQFTAEKNHEVLMDIYDRARFAFSNPHTSN